MKPLEKVRGAIPAHEHTGVMIMKLIPNWKSMWRAWSVRLNALGLTILAWFAIDPVSLLAVWNMMPPAVHDIIPTQFLSGVGALLFALSMIARLVKQPKMEAKNGEAA